MSETPQICSRNIKIFLQVYFFLDPSILNTWVLIRSAVLRLWVKYFSFGCNFVLCRMYVCSLSDVSLPDSRGWSGLPAWQVIAEWSSQFHPLSILLLPVPEKICEKSALRPLVLTSRPPPPPRRMEGRPGGGGQNRWPTGFACGRKRRTGEAPLVVHSVSLSNGWKDALYRAFGLFHID